MKYVITYAQNATPVHADFWGALLQYCKHNDARLIVIPGRYRNPTSHWSQRAASDDWWDEAVVPYILRGREKLCKNLYVYGEISIQPTAVRPLSGFEIFAGPASAVFGHPKIQLTTVPAAKRRYPRILTTTGAATKPNYTDSKAGKKAAEHHVQGATVVETDGDYFHLRQLNATRSGDFIDLDRTYTANGSWPADRPAALVCGDLHVAKMDPQVSGATFFDGDSIMKTLRPRRLVLHDVLDFDVRNHHNKHSFRDRYARHHGERAKDDVRSEVELTAEYLRALSKMADTYVIHSNHDEAFDRWLNDADPKADPQNARFFHAMWAALLGSFHQRGEWVPAFEHYCKLHGLDKIEFIRRDQDFRIHGIACGFHGDKGANGARGNALAYARLGVKSIVGHMHTPAILDGCYVVGVTADLDQGYNLLPSSWLNSHCLVHANGKRQLIHIIDGRWRA